jgi:AcrR family transcriptional regulator
MAAKRPRRTPERILDAALGLFNRYGEPNVSTTAIASELAISPGNLYYHFASKDDLVNRLFDRYAEQLETVLQQAGDVRTMADAWIAVHSLFTLIWAYRFLYRDLNDLLSKNRHLEVQFQAVLDHKTRAVQALIGGMRRHEGLGALDTHPQAADAVATAMVVVITYWLSFEYVKAPRDALDPVEAEAALVRGAFNALSLLMPYLDETQRERLLTMAAAPVAASAGRQFDPRSGLDTEPGALDASTAGEPTAQWPLHGVAPRDLQRAAPMRTPPRKS